MKRILNFSLLFAFSILLASCEKEEKPVTLPGKPAEVKLLSVSMGKDYATQIFLNIANGKTTSIENTCWDLAFDASTTGTAIFQNSGKNLLIGNSGSKEFKPYPDLKKILWQWDAPSGAHDSLALKNCIDSEGKPTDSVFLVRFGSAPPFCQFRIKQITSGAYIIEVSNIENTWIKQTEITKDPNKFQVYFSFANGGTYLNLEPSKNDWHLCFLRYRWIYYEFNPPLLYLVSGVFTNQHLVSAVKDSVGDFYDLTRADCAAKNFLARRDVIGYDWKTPDLSNTSSVNYTIRKDYHYFIKEKAGEERLFKLRFLDFYDNNGVKGTPKFEAQQLY